MTDTIIKGTGNSRLLKSVPNLRTLIPAGGDLIDLLTGDGLPVDLSGLQAAGVDIMGTDYSKAICLPDSVEQAIWGSAANRNIGQALQQLRSQIITADSKIPNTVTGGYTGTGYNALELSFPFAPKMVVISIKYAPVNSKQKGYLPPLVLVAGTTRTVFAVGSLDIYAEGLFRSILDVSFYSNSVRIYNSDTADPAGCRSFNLSGMEYGYFAIG